LRIGLFDYNYWFVLYDLCFHLLLLSRFEVAFVLSLLAHALYGIHNITLLRQKRVAQICGPANVVCHALYYIGKSSKCLNTWIPWLFCHGIGKGFVLQARVAFQPLLKLNDFERISGRCQDLGKQRIRVEGYGSHERIELVWSYFICCCLR
jgi:hypothetical protein